MEQEKSVQELYNELDGNEPTPNEENEALVNEEHEPVVDEGVEDTTDSGLPGVDNEIFEPVVPEEDEPEVEVKAEEEPAPEPEPEQETGGVEADALLKAKQEWLDSQKPAIDVSDLDQLAATVETKVQPVIPGEAPVINLDEAIEKISEEHGEDVALAAAKMIQAVAPQIQQQIEYTNLQQINTLNQQTQESQQYLKTCKDRFYEAYPELNDHLDLVGVYTQQVTSEYPNAKPHQLLNEIGKRTTNAVNTIKEKAGLVGSKKPARKANPDELGTAAPRPSADRITGMKEAEKQKLSDSQKHLIDLANFVG